MATIEPAPPGSAGHQGRWQPPRWLWLPLFLFALTRLGIALVAYIAGPLILDSANPPPYHVYPDNILLDTFASRWDTGFYLSIATEGYRYQGVPLPSVAFFPLLPLFIRLFLPLVGDAGVAGLLVANGALALASILFYRLVDMEWGGRIAERALWYLLIFPVSFFGSAVYTESLFLLGAIGALYFARRGYWESAGMLAFMTALTRLVGLIVAPMLLVEWWMQRRARPPETRPGRAALLAPLAAPLGTLAYLGFLQLRFGDPLAFVRASAAWAREPAPIWVTLASLLESPAEGWPAALLAGRFALSDGLDLLFVLSFLLIGLLLLRERRWSEALFVLMGVLIPLNSGLLMSQRRYMWVLFPAFILLARWGENPRVDRALTTLFLLGLALFTALFANWYWVG